MHIMGVVCWFAGLFYIVRLFIYHVEAEEKEESIKQALQEQFKVMQRRLWYGITVPAAWVTAMMGGHLLGVMRAWEQPWFHLKGTALIFLLVYHFYCGKIRKNLEQDKIIYSSKFLRIFNEVATLLLVLIVFTVVVKSLTHIAYGMIGFFILALLLGLFLRKRLQGKKSS